MEQERADSPAAGDTSSTVDKAVRVLEALAHEPDGVSLGELVHLLNTHRAPLYRILRSLEAAHYLRRRPTDRKYELAFGIKRIAQAVPDRFREAFEPRMREVCRAASVTGMLNVMEGAHLVLHHTESPPEAGIRLVADVGYVFDLTSSAAPVVAALSRLPPSPSDSEAVIQCRKDGFAYSSGSIRSGVSGIAVPFTAQGSIGSVSFVRAGQMDDDELEALIPQAIEAIAQVEQASESQR
ncbi:IclR family transcriptional regulator [Citricoccus sp. GCM10030269]|uniref:IclR family transcriptional regulator n=1 Tax=Citricoccus sp. GCM10030269 TaxID=3273388 RepID=UPI0036232988